MALTPIAPQTCADWLRRSRHVVALTGAGLSTAAGIPDFRGPEGLYASGEHDPELIFDIDAFRRDPGPFYRFTRTLLPVLQRCEPTFTHRFLAHLETVGILAGVVTQNIDLLHQQAGSRRLVPVHGSYAAATCLRCDSVVPGTELLERLEAEAIPHCPCGGVFKPNVVFFGEAVAGFPEAVALIDACDLLLVLGSSLTVQPAAGLPAYTRAPTIVINQAPVPLPPAPHRHQALSELDPFFRAVAAHLDGALLSEKE